MRDFNFFTLVDGEILSIEAKINKLQQRKQLLIMAKESYTDKINSLDDEIDSKIESIKNNIR